ncbi:MAG: acetoin utilization protein AcuC [Candidatus Krumholzibacteriota bacterium]|nr:acetoin utilization protein AcuC [Candidatus Krumholzibacteriota bacterium]
MTAEGKTKAVFMNPVRLGGYSFTPDHPFKPERLTRVFDMCRERGLFSGSGIVIDEIDEAEPGILETFHSAEYIDMLKKADSGGEIDIDMIYHGIGTMENPVFRGVYDFSVLSATASVKAARHVAEDSESAFNPCGGFHHAHSSRASGFCYVNDIVLAILELKRLGRKVAYVDIDAHHGDGVQEAFYSDPEVLTISIHESGKTLFPWGGSEKETGSGKGTGFNINIPLETDTDDDIFLLLFRGIIIDAVEAFGPDIIVGQFGTDTFSTDPLTHLRMTNNGYIEAISELHGRFPRIMATGGGGYNMDDVVKGWTLLWAELAGIELGGGYGGALGGVFLGDSSIYGSDLRDMRIVTSGPRKEDMLRDADRKIAWYRENIRPYLD